MPWSTSTRRANLPSDWARIRRRALARDGHQCTAIVNGIRCSARATDVHHIRHADNHELTNLASLCAPCHKRETSQEAADARLAGPRAQRPREPHPGIV